MSTILFKRGTTSQLDQYVGKEGELVIDSENKTLRVFDGTNKGGYLIGGLDVIDGGVIPEPIPTFVKRSDYNIYIVSVNKNVVFDPIMIWVRVNPNDKSKLQFWDETKDSDWNDSIRTTFDVTVTSAQSADVDVEDIINNNISAQAMSILKDSMTYYLYGANEKELFAYYALGYNTWDNEDTYDYCLYTHTNQVNFNGIKFTLPNPNGASTYNWSIAIYANVFEKDCIPG